MHMLPMHFHSTCNSSFEGVNDTCSTNIPDQRDNSTSEICLLSVDIKVWTWRERLTFQTFTSIWMCTSEALLGISIAQMFFSPSLCYLQSQISFPDSFAFLPSPTITQLAISPLSHFSFSSSISSAPIPLPVSPSVIQSGSREVPVD